MANRKHLNLVTLWLLDTRGEGRMLTGGLERWCRDLADLAIRKGYDVTVFQKAERNFEHRLPNGVLVHGLACSLHLDGNWTVGRWLLKNTDLNDPFVFVSQEMATCDNFKRAAAVNHGIWWNADKPWWKRILIKQLQRRLLRRLKGIICVDTNYVNWCHAEIPDRPAWESKLHYIPNYADLNLFPVQKVRQTAGGQMVLLFPRRIPGDNLERHARGIGLMLASFEILHRRGRDVHLLVAGRGELQPKVENWAKVRGLSDRIELVEASLDDMPSLYRRADVVVVPSIAHEGTSLAAIEGLVSGKPMVTTAIGGLPNIVLPGLTGHIADLDPKSLADKIEAAYQEHLLDRPQLLAACRTALGKDRWEKEVWNCLQSCLELPDDSSASQNV
jgi:glycosyltransferase involved in cell wall biosynthesis